MRAAIIGIGAIARLHAKALADIPGIELVAASCRTEEKGRAFAGEFGCTWHADAAKMLRREKPDFVTVATPSGAHLEAVMAAVKAARAYTGRPLVAKFEGGYHGAYDHVEVSLDAGPDTWGDPTAPAAVPYAAGVPGSVAAETVVLPFNDAEAVTALIERHGDRLAAVLVDTLPSRIGMPAPDPAFLHALWAAARRCGAVIIADEVISHLAGLVGANVRVTLEIQAEVPSGVPDTIVRIVTENGRTLKFTSQGFELE